MRHFRTISGLPILQFFREAKSMININGSPTTEKEIDRRDEPVVMDCGRASEWTRGSPVGFGLENGFPPFNWWLPH
jgi:hypothetical protein